MTNTTSPSIFPCRYLVYTSLLYFAVARSLLEFCSCYPITFEPSPFYTEDEIQTNVRTTGITTAMTHTHRYWQQSFSLCPTRILAPKWWKIHWRRHIYPRGRGRSSDLDWVWDTACISGRSVVYHMDCMHCLSVKIEMKFRSHTLWGDDLERM